MLYKAKSGLMVIFRVLLIIGVNDNCSFPFDLTSSSQHVFWCGSIRNKNSGTLLRSWLFV